MQTKRLILASALLHLALLAIFLQIRHQAVPRSPHPGTALGTRIALTYAPGSPSPQTARALRKPVYAKPTPAFQPPTPSYQNPAENGSALGSGSVTIALATFFPNPKPDLTQLPHGTRGDVIIDVTIDEHGNIVSTQVAQSMGTAIDNAVLSTVQTWTYKPATKDGVPVPSEQEILFHYERG